MKSSAFFPVLLRTRTNRLSLLVFWGTSSLLLGNQWDARAQTAVSPPPVAVPPVATTGTQAVGPNFRLQAGDVLSVQVANHPEMSAAEVAVAANGKLNLPVVAPVSAQNRTIGQVQNDIVRAYRTQLKNPQVSITLVRSLPRQMIVSGAVARPGSLDVRGNLRLSDAIDLAGGLLVKPEEVKATLVTTRGEKKIVDIATARTSPQSPANILVMAGDRLNIVALPVIQVVLTGDNIAPAVVKLQLSTSRPTVKVKDALVAGGSLRTAKPEQTIGTLIRNNEKLSIDVPALFDVKDPSANFPLQDGDQLNFSVIPTKNIGVSVVSLDGAVKTPGNFTFENEASTLRTLVQAGGLSAPADQISVTVRRNGQVIPVDVERAALDPRLDVPLEDRDVIFASLNPATRIRLTGSIAKPELYRLRENATLLDAVTTAGGLTLPPAQTAIRILRTTPEGKQIGIDVDAIKLYDLKDLSQNVRLQDGDLVFFSESRRGRQVYVSGEVGVPGAYELGDGDGVAELLLKAGGPKPTGLLSRLSITSKSNAQRLVDVSSLRTGTGQKPEVQLEQGDFVVVPRNEARVTVLSAVARPDNYPIPESGNFTLGDALLAAGGPLSNAKLKEVIVVHRLPGGQTSRTIVPVSDIQKGGTTANTIDYPLQNGDIVWVTQGKVTAGVMKQLGAALGTLGLVQRVF